MKKKQVKVRVRWTGPIGGQWNREVRISRNFVTVGCTKFAAEELIGSLRRLYDSDQCLEILTSPNGGSVYHLRAYRNFVDTQQEGRVAWTGVKKIIDVHTKLTKRKKRK